MIYEVILSPNAQEDIVKHRKSGDKSILRKIDNILDELSEHPQTGIGRPERMKHELSGCWSREITQKHRMVYTIEEETVSVDVLYAYGHYFDK
jgi:toxin YoeB